ncbi:hypothetical protein Bbelb_339900 [Branchiostoma belcheri]|nr:hypothetical protein Bbelb_339900 [Branchiostoma belcheri]
MERNDDVASIPVADDELKRHVSILSGAPDRVFCQDAIRLDMPESVNTVQNTPVTLPARYSSKHNLLSLVWSKISHNSQKRTMIFSYYPGVGGRSYGEYEGRAELVGKASLQLDRTTSEDEGEYVLEITFDEIGREEGFVRLNVMVPPVVQVGPSDPYVTTMGRTATLTCAVRDAKPNVTALHWERDGVKLDSARSRTKYGGGNVDVPTLHVRGVTRADAGLYTCVVSHVVSPAAASLKLIVLYRASIIRISDSQEAQLKDRVTLECIADGDPAPNVTWSKDGVRLASKTHALSGDVRSGTVTLGSLTVNDTGTYLCTASNGVGEAHTKTTHLAVTGRTDWIPVYTEEDDSSVLRQLAAADRRYLVSVVFLCTSQGGMVAIPARFGHCVNVMHLVRLKPVSHSAEYGFLNTTETSPPWFRVGREQGELWLAGILSEDDSSVLRQPAASDRRYLVSVVFVCTSQRGLEDDICVLRQPAAADRRYLVSDVFLCTSQRGLQAVCVQRRRGMNSASFAIIVGAVAGGLWLVFTLGLAVKVPEAECSLCWNRDNEKNSETTSTNSSQQRSLSHRFNDVTAGKRYARALYPFMPTEENELALEVDDVIEVLEGEDGGWCLGFLRGRIGLFPSNYVKFLSASEALSFRVKDTLTNSSAYKINSVVKFIDKFGRRGVRPAAARSSPSAETALRLPAGWSGETPLAGGARDGAGLSGRNVLNQLFGIPDDLYQYAGDDGKLYSQQLQVKGDDRPATPRKTGGDKAQLREIEIGHSSQLLDKFEDAGSLVIVNVTTVQLRTLRVISFELIKARQCLCNRPFLRHFPFAVRASTNWRQAGIMMKRFQVALRELNNTAAQLRQITSCWPGEKPAVRAAGDIWGSGENNSQLLPVEDRIRLIALHNSVSLTNRTNCHPQIPRTEFRRPQYCVRRVQLTIAQCFTRRSQLVVTYLRQTYWHPARAAGAQTDFSLLLSTLHTGSLSNNNARQSDADKT